ncbi:MAG: isochorismate synthase MenF [Acidimicrobiales bacterium]
MLHRSRRLDRTVDLNDVCRGDGMLFVRDGVGAAGRGVALALDETGIAGVLSGLSPAPGSEPPGPGHGPVVFCRVPFRPDLPADAFLPRLTVTKDGSGATVATVTGPDGDSVSDAALDAALDEALSSRAPVPAAGSFTVSPATPVDSYLAAVTAARDAVRAGRLSKAVIARDVRVTAEQPIDVHAVLLRLRASFGRSYRFCVDGLVGASPELLVQVEGRTVRSHPLAGTAPRTGDPDTDRRLADELVASTKNQVEHRVVIDMVHDTLLPRCSYLDWEPEPSIVTVANVQHLGTAIEGALSEPRPPVMDLVRDLCPTPALGGHPGAEAIEFIRSVETSERGHYGGAVGILDSHGNGTFAVTIRCAVLSADRRTATLFAGGGIVAESEPLAELAETQAKFQAMLSALVRP